MMKGDSSGSSKKRVTNNDYGFTETIFSWSLEDIFNEDLYKNQVKKIELSFSSVDHYLRSYEYPLLEETRAQLCSSMQILYNVPFAEVIGVEEAKPFKKKLYNLKIDTWRNRFTRQGKEPYKTLPGDVLVLADCKPETANDLQRVGRMWSFVLAVKTTEDENEDDGMPIHFKVKASKDIRLNEGRHKSLFLVYLTNISSNRRIWSALHMSGNLKLIQQILCASDVDKESCDCYSSQNDALRDDNSYQRLSSELNESQNKAISACLSSLGCNHKSTVRLIWGPPGTGKTKTLAILLSALRKMNFRILICAPTNVAIKEVASRVLSMVRESFVRESGDLFCSVGDMLLFGNNERLKVGADIEDIYLDHRVQQLTRCFSPSTGWSSCFASMIDLLKNCVTHYHIFIENYMREIKKTSGKNNSDCIESKSKSFLKFLRERFVTTVLPLKCCISILCTHVARSHVLEHNYQNLVCLNKALESFQDLLFRSDFLYEGLEKLFSHPEMPENSSCSLEGAEYQLYMKRNECLSTLTTLNDSLDGLKLTCFSVESIKKFCFQSSLLIFCTASNSYKLHSVAMKPLNLLVIDEAAQLKECESVIPLLLPGISHAILFGDQCQLPSTVESNVSYEVGLGRSLFERLSSLGQTKYLLNMQHRMHPSISFFPNSRFYFNQIQDAPNVQRENYGKQYLPWPMFGPYSFINISGGREEFDDDGRSRKNMAEVAVVMTILKNLHKAWLSSKEKLSIGIVSPYAAQVLAIQQELGQMYDSHDGFDVNVKSIDGFQGGEKDVIILSTVRTNNRTSLDFISSPKRTNVALTRARHCLWILGNERVLANNDNVWRAVVLDAKNRQCFFNADEDKELMKAILDAKKELDQFDELLNTNSILFRNARWKVHFSDYFLRSFKRLRSEQTKNLVISLLQRLSSGWRPRRTNVELSCENSSQMLKQFKVESRYVVCSIDIIKYSKYTQVLKIWDILPLEDIPKLVKRLDSTFRRYTDDYIRLCKEKRFEGIIEIPVSWPNSVNIQKFKSVNNGNEGNLNASASDGKSYAETSKVEESLLLMKYHSFSPGNLLFGHSGLEFDLPFEVTDQERKIILFPLSTFVLGRSGTGKTTVMATKLFQNEKLHHMAVEAVYVANNASREKESKESAVENDRPILRQLFVTLSAELCQAVKHQISPLKRSHFKGSISAESSSIDEDIVDPTIQFKNIPDSFIDLPPSSYPLVVTFRKFLMMLDGTLGKSYFERFRDLKNSSYSKNPGSVPLETFIRKKEVNYERFDSLYWPHFSSQLSKKLDSYLVFTEIVSHIKGGLQAAEHGKLSREDYVILSEKRASWLNKQTREVIYDIYQNYEKMKMDNGEFDLADIVIDLHRRLRTERYQGDEMNFVYIDEVQDLTLAQIALFRYICQNVEEGFVFCGDTAQTIGKGIDFRFQDVRSLFYRKFVLESKNRNHDKRKERGQVSDIFLLSQNFRTNARVLKLSQSIIEVLFHFFPHSVDLLKPETSLIFGEAPVLVESGNPIAKIFGGSGYKVGKIGGFGADQVILVRDDFTRKEILHRVGIQALVLTILECMGLDFEDVLLYNFFASSPFRKRWWVLYDYMKEQHILDPREHIICPGFDDLKHKVLCSELKQLYVAVTRTRSRLWICESEEEFSKPMFDYWKKKDLVQVKYLDDSIVEAMKVASSPEEWKSRGMKLYYQNNYDMATKCFERAGDTHWKRKSKDAGLRATANRFA